MRAALLAGLIVGLAAVAGPAVAQRVMSLDSCADQYVLALAARETIVGVSPRADAPDSFLRAKAVGLPQRRTTLEAVLGARPDVAVRQWGGDARLTAALDRRGVRTVSLQNSLLILTKSPRKSPGRGIGTRAKEGHTNAMA